MTLRLAHLLKHANQTAAILRLTADIEAAASCSDEKSAEPGVGPHVPGVEGDRQRRSETRAQDVWFVACRVRRTLNLPRLALAECRRPGAARQAHVLTQGVRRHVERAFRDCVTQPDRREPVQHEWRRWRGGCPLTVDG